MLSLAAGVSSGIKLFDPPPSLRLTAPLESFAASHPEIPSWISETLSDQLAAQLVAEGILDESLKLKKIPETSLPALDRNALYALVKLLTEKITIKCGDSLRDSELNLRHFFEGLKDPKNPFHEQIEEITIIGGAVPWILSGAPQGEKEFSSDYLEAFFEKIGFSGAVSQKLKTDFGKCPPDIDLRLVAPKATPFHLQEFPEEVDHYIRSKINPPKTFKNVLSKRHVAHGENKSYSIAGFDASLNKHEMSFDCLFVKELPDWFFLVRDALYIPLNDVLLQLEDIWIHQGLKHYCEKIKSGDLFFEVIPQSYYREGAWQSILDRILGVARMAEGKTLQYTDWALLLSIYVKGKRSWQPGLESLLISQLCTLGEKEQFLFPQAVQDQLRKLKEEEKFPFLAALGLKKVLKSHHKNQEGALEALTLQACVSLRSCSEFSKELQDSYIEALWKEMCLPISEKYETPLKTAKTGLFGTIRGILDKEPSMVGSILDLLQIQAFNYLCSGETSDAFKSTFLMHNGRPHLQLEIDGHHILMEFDPKIAFTRFMGVWKGGEEGKKGLLGLIVKQIGFPSQFVSSKESILDRNLEQLNAHGFDIFAFRSFLEEEIQESFSIITREMLISCYRLTHERASRNIYSNFSSFLKHCSNDSEVDELLKKGSCCWPLDTSLISTFLNLRDNKRYKDISLQLLWVLALAKNPDSAISGQAYPSYQKCKESIPLEFQNYVQEFFVALAKSRPIQAATLLKTESELSISQIAATLGAILHSRQKMAPHDKEIASSIVREFMHSLIVENPVNAVKVLANISRDCLNNLMGQFSGIDRESMSMDILGLTSTALENEEMEIAKEIWSQVFLESKTPMALILDVLIKSKMSLAKSWIDWIEHTKSIKDCRKDVIKACNHLLELSEDHLIVGSPQDCAAAILYAAKTLKGLEKDAFIGISDKISYLERYFIENEELLKEMLSLFQDSVSDKKTSCLSHKVVSGVDSEVNSESLSTSKVSSMEVFKELLGGSSAKIITVLKNEAFISDLKKDPEHLIKLETLYSNSSKDKKDVILMAALLIISSYSVEEYKEGDLQIWIEPFINRLKTPVSSSPLEGVVARFFNTLLKLTSHQCQNKKIFLSLFTSYVNFESKKKMSLDTVTADCCIKMACLTIPVCREKEQKTFIGVLANAYKEGVFSSASIDQKREFLENVIDVLVKFKFQDDAEDLIFSFVQLVERGNDIWEDKAFCIKAKRWIEESLLSGAFYNLKRVSAPTVKQQSLSDSSVHKIQGLLHVALRAHHMSYELYEKVLSLSSYPLNFYTSILKSLPPDIQKKFKNEIFLGRYIEETISNEGFQQQRGCTSPLDKAKKMNALISFLCKNSASHLLYKILEQPQTYIDFLKSGIGDIECLRSIGQVLMSVVKAENREVIDFLGKWERLSAPIAAYMTELEKDEKIKSNEEIADLLCKQKMLHKLLDIIVNVNNSRENPIAISKFVEENFYNGISLNEILLCVPECSSLLLPKIRKDVLYQVCKAIVPKTVRVTELTMLEIVKVNEAINASKSVDLTMRTRKQTLEENLKYLAKNIEDIFCKFSDEAEPEDIIMLIDELSNEPNSFLRGCINELLCHSTLKHPTILEARIAYLSNAALVQFPSFSVEGSVDQLISQICEFVTQQEKELDRVFSENFLKTSDKTYLLAFMIGFCCQKLISHSDGDNVKVSVIRKELIVKALALILGLKSLYQREYCSKENVLKIKLEETRALTNAFVKIITLDKDLNAFVEICSFMAITTLYKQDISNLTKDYYDLRVVGMFEILSGVFEHLNTSSDEEINERTRIEILECFEQFIFLPNPCASHKHFKLSVIALQSAIGKGLFKNDPVNLFKYCSKIPVKAFVPSELQLDLEEKLQVFDVMEKVTNRLLEDGRIEEAVIYAECCNKKEEQVFAKGVKSDKTLPQDAKDWFLKTTLEVNEIKSQIFLLDPFRYFALLKHTYQKVVEFSRLKEMNEFQSATFKVFPLTSLVNSYLTCLSLSVRNKKFESCLSFLDCMKDLCLIFEENDTVLSVPLKEGDSESVFTAKAFSITLLLLSQEPKTDEEKNAQANAVKFWLDILKKSKNPKTVTFIQQTSDLIKLNRSLLSRMEAIILQEKLALK